MSGSGLLFFLPPLSAIPELNYPFHDKTDLVTHCGRLFLYRKKINLSPDKPSASRKSTTASGWSASWITISVYRSGGENLAAPAQSLRAKNVTYVLGTICYPCLRADKISVVGATGLDL